MNITRLIGFRLSVILAMSLVAPLSLSAGEWPSWRGDVLGSGDAGDVKAPTEWGKEKNVRWRVKLPERGNSTPIVWGDRIYVTQPVEAEGWRGVMCFNRADGKLLWKNGVIYDKPERTHKANPYASGSPATDGELIFCGFGSAGVAAYDMDGKQVWHRDFGPIDHVWGNSTSPVLFGDLCIYYHGPGDGAFLAALDKKTGKTVWKFDEPKWETAGRTDGFKGKEPGIVGSFSTPIIVKTDTRTELIMSFPNEVRAFDPTTGKELWRCGGLNPLVYTSPVYADGVVVAMGGYYGNSIGVKVGGSGDVTDTHRLWQRVRHNGGIGTGVVKDGKLYYQNSGGIAYCLDIKTGQDIWEARLPGHAKTWGSYTMIGDLIYSLHQGGQTVVFKADPTGLKVVAENDLGEMTNSSIVVSDGDLLIRTHEALWCIGGVAAE